MRESRTRMCWNMKDIFTFLWHVNRVNQSLMVSYFPFKIPKIPVPSPFLQKQILRQDSEFHYDSENLHLWSPTWVSSSSWRALSFGWVSGWNCKKELYDDEAAPVVQFARGKFQARRNFPNSRWEFNLVTHSFVDWVIIFQMKKLFIINISH